MVKFFVIIIILLYNTMIIHVGKSGLCCRLRVLLRVMEIYKNDKIKIIWLINSATVDEIGKYIMPINNIEFLPTNSDNIKFDHYYDHRLSRKPIDNKIILNNLSKIKLCQELQNKVDNFYLQNYPYISIHVRRTDFSRYYRNLSHTRGSHIFLDNEPFYNFIKKNNKYKVFLTTDCATTRALFKEKYRDKIITCHNSFENVSLRQVNMENTLLDLFIAGRGIDFLGSFHSTFSIIIEKLIILNKNEIDLIL